MLKKSKFMNLFEKWNFLPSWTPMSFACMSRICLELSRIVTCEHGLLDVFKPYYAVLYHFSTGMLKTYFKPRKTHP